MLKFLGIGSAFNTKLGNTSAYIKIGDHLLLIDCGGTVFHRLRELQVLEGVKHLAVAITHTHPDHVGSLGDLIFYAHYVMGIQVKLFFPQPDLILPFLNAIGVTADLYTLHADYSAIMNAPEFGAVNLLFEENSHVDPIPAFGLYLSTADKCIYYSGDANEIKPSVLEGLINGKIDRVYMDTCGLEYEGNCHCSLNKLAKYVPLNLRNKVYCMHLDEAVTPEAIRVLGFEVVTVEEND